MSASALVPTGILHSDLLTIHQQRLSRIVEECLDVAFILCNNEAEEFGIAKIFDVFDQVLPTAFVMNTGFWPFFNTTFNQCLCVCGRYGLYCRHTRGLSHWIDMKNVPVEENGPKFYPKIIGALYATDYNIQLAPMNDDNIGYNITINLRLQYKKPERGRPRRQEKPKKLLHDIKLDGKQIYNVSINARYNLSREFYPSFYTIIFQPNPFFHENYGSYFTKLLDYRSSFQWPPNALNDIQRFFTVPVNHMPTTSLLLFHVNLPIYCMPTQVCATFPQLQPIRVKYQRTKRNKAVQTCLTDSTTWQHCSHFVPENPCSFGNAGLFENGLDFQYDEPMSVNNLNTNGDSRVFAVLQPPIVIMSEEEIDEEFQIIEEYIKEDVLATDSNLEWWYANHVN